MTKIHLILTGLVIKNCKTRRLRLGLSGARIYDDEDDTYDDTIDKIARYYGDD